MAVTDEPRTTSPPRGSRQVTWPLVLHSEWTKFASLRSSFWTLVTTVVAAVGLGALICFSYASNHAHATRAAEVGPTGISLAGIFLAQLAIGVLGVLVISSEYRTGMIRTTLAAAPQRGAVLGAKTAVVAAVAVVVGVASSLGAFFVGQEVLRIQSLQTTIGAPGVLRAVIGGGLYLAVVCLLGLGIGAVVRHVPGAIAILVSLVFVLPGVAQALPQTWQHVVVKVLPSTAGEAVYQTRVIPHHLGPWVGFGVLCAWAALALVLGWILIDRRDA